MKLSIVEKIGFGAGDMAINVVIIAMQLLSRLFLYRYLRPERR